LNRSPLVANQQCRLCSPGIGPNRIRQIIRVNLPLGLVVAVIGGSGDDIEIGKKYRCDYKGAQYFATVVGKDDKGVWVTLGDIINQHGDPGDPDCGGPGLRYARMSAGGDRTAWLAFLNTVRTEHFDQVLALRPLMAAIADAA
jgi:hypothetical protein